jgi:NNP family nitrate/nitrite transporter-like MFS transporter
MNLSDLKKSGHWPTLLTSFLYFDVSFTVWTILGALAPQIVPALHLSDQAKFFMVALPTLSGALLRIVLGLLVDQIGGKPTGILAQLIVIAGLVGAWIFGFPAYWAALLMGFILGFAGASFAVALPQAGRWYPPHMQGLVMGLAGAGNIGVVIDSLVAPTLAAKFGWQNVFGFVLIPIVIVFVIYVLFAKDAPVEVKAKKLSDYLNLLRQQDAHWFCFYYTVSFGGFVGLATGMNLYFKDQYGYTPVICGYLSALCTFAGAMSRPVGGAMADRFGGIRALTVFYAIASFALLGAAFLTDVVANVVFLTVACAAFGMANGSVFQLLPQRFAREMGVMTGLVGCGGGVGGFLLNLLLGWSEHFSGHGHFALGLCIFAFFGSVAIGGLTLVKTRWRTTWGALGTARI